jgi:PAS domain-containing protein
MFCVMEAGLPAQKPLELILARNLLASVATPAFLIDTNGVLVFFNEAAGALLGRQFEETGKLGPNEWGRLFGPYDDNGNPVWFEDMSITRALREGHATHAHLELHSSTGDAHRVEVSAMPLVSTEGGFRGALAFFWPVDGEVEQR